jgi:attractin
MKCRFIGNRTTMATANENADPTLCQPSCAALTTCGNCTQEECIWCQNEQRCVDKNAYTASFPYGQCREWTTMSNKCRATTTGKSQCGFYKTCQQCRDDPACGWCDDGE